VEGGALDGRKKFLSLRRGGGGGGGGGQEIKSLYPAKEWVILSFHRIE